MTDAKRPTILIVEDDMIVRMETADIFVDAGFAVIEAHDGATALDLIERHPKIAVVFADIQLPGALSGLGLAKIISARWPRISIMVCSGAVVPSPGRLPRDTPFFSKPYDMKQASIAAHALMAASPSGRQPISKHFGS